MNRQMQKINSTALGLLLIVTLTITSSGCFGGGTIGTGLTPTGFGGGKQGSGIQFNFIGTVLNIRNTPIANATVTIETSFGLVSRKTDSAGRFRAPLTITSGEYLKIDVSSGANHYSQRQQISPAGASEVYQTIKLEEGGKLELK
jgi:hypothetical protein